MCWASDIGVNHRSLDDHACAAWAGLQLFEIPPANSAACAAAVCAHLDLTSVRRTLDR